MADIVLVPAVKGACKGGVVICKGLLGSDCKRVEQKVNKLLPVIEGLYESSSESASNLSPQKFKEFRDNLVKVNQLAEDHKNSSNPARKINDNQGVKKVEKAINEFIQNDLQVIMMSAQEHLSAQLKNVSALQGYMLNAQVQLSTQLESVSEEMGSVRERVEALHEAVVTGQQTLVEAIRQVDLKNSMSKYEEQQIERSRQDMICCGPPKTPIGLEGFDEHKMKLKNLLLGDAVDVVGITAMGGAGKSTLAAAVCNEDEIKGYFERVIYVEVPEMPDILTILKIMWKKIVDGPRNSTPDFTNISTAREELQSAIKSRILVVLDNVCSKSHLENLLFKEKHYKTLVTTRSKTVIQMEPDYKIHVYELPLLQKKNALSLFCQYAFRKPNIPIDCNEELVEKVQQQCSGLPLALKVIGSSLYGKLDDDWNKAEKRLSAGEPFNDDHEEIINKLKTSIDELEDNERQCFVDLGAFPQRKAIPAKELLDIWVYVRGMKSSRADKLLQKFADRYLLDLKKNPGTSEITDSRMDGYFVSQHDMMRDLALYLANQDDGRRLYMPKMKNHLPKEWDVLSSKARIVSIHSEGAMHDSDWPKKGFPEAEALVLYFTASEYCIPTFLLHTMKNLKVLIIHSTEGAKRSKLSGVAGFQGLSELKTLHLHRLIVPEEWKFLKSLKKIYMTLCEGLGSDKTFNFPELLEFNVSYCFDLEELPTGLCSSLSLKKLSVTHCHRLEKLPDEMGRLESLKHIRLLESPSLKALPSSICNLKKLKYLDISSCISLNVNRRERCGPKETLQAVAKMPSLERVICDKENEQLFKQISRTDLKVQAFVEQEPNLVWLDLKI